MAATVALTNSDLLHRSRHVDTVQARWHGRDVVAKLVRDDLLASGDRAAIEHAMRQVLHEATLLRRVRDAHIMRALAISDDPAILVLERAEGRTLRDELRERRILPPTESIVIGLQLCSALTALHRAGFLHRDIKPANVMYRAPTAESTARTVLIDLHLAREMGDMKGGAGTRLFSAPEQVRGGIVGASADVWGLGVVLYRCVTGKLPFRAREGHPQLTRRAAPSLARLAHARFGGDIATAALHLPRPLADVVDQMLDPVPARRPDVDQIRHALAALARSRTAA